MAWRVKRFVFDNPVAPLVAETTLKKGQKIRVRAIKAAQDWGVSVGAEGVVLCRYSLVARGRENERCVDVHFEPGVVVWGAPVAAFEEVIDPHQEFVGA